MFWATAIRCSQCQQPIAPGERFVSFKIPGKESYQFFHRRLPETAGRVTSRRTSEASRARRVCAAACQRYHPHYPFEFRLPARMRNCEQATFP